MDATFASPVWRESLQDLGWGGVFAALKDELLWVLETTVSDDSIRSDKARDLVLGMAWLGDAYAAFCVINSHLYRAPPTRTIQITTNLSLLAMPSQSFSKADQDDFLAEVHSNLWPCKSWSQDDALMVLELAVMRWYVKNSTGNNTDLLLQVKGEVGVFYIYPNEKSLLVQKALAVH